MKFKIPFSKAYLGKEEARAARKALKSGWITTGPEVAKFEEEFADYVGSKYAVATSSCTSALELALRYYEVGKGDIVITPSFTFCATAQAAINCGASILFGEIELIKLTLNPDSFVLDNYASQAKAIIPVHLAGNEAYTDYKTNVVEDSAHRIEKDQCKGNKNLVCFSFYPTKNMTTGEGGMIATNDEKAYKWLRLARNHGIDKSDERRYKEGSYGYDVAFNGMKANMSDIAAAIGREQLKKLPWMTKRRNQIVEWYNKELEMDWKGNHLYPIFIKDRDQFIEFMGSHGVQCSAHFSPLHKMTAFKELSEMKLPLTETLGETEVSLPLYPEMKKKDVLYICDLIRSYKNQYV